MIKSILLVALGGGAGSVLLSALYIGASVVVGVLAVWGGLKLVGE